MGSVSKLAVQPRAKQPFGYIAAYLLLLPLRIFALLIEFVFYKGLSDDSILYEGSLISRARSANEGAVVDFANVAGIAATRAGGVVKKDWQIAF